MQKKQDIVTLPEAERARLHTLVGGGTAPARALTHARLLLKANQGEGGPGWTEAVIAEALEVGRATVARVRRAYGAAGLEAALTHRAPDRDYLRKLGGAGGAARRAGLRRSPGRSQALEPAPAGRAARRAGGRGHGLVRDRATDLKATALKPHLQEQWCIPRAARRSASTRPAASCSAM